MLHNSIRLFTIRGIEVGVHYSWLIIFALVTWSLSTQIFPSVPDEPVLSDVEYWVLGALTAILMFSSVLIHELAHSFVALRRGLNAKSITLFIFGGVSNLSGEAKEASTEFLVAIVGPITSFVLAGIFFGIATVSSEPHVELVASYLFLINLVLGIFNLVPGFPLDGGRVLRAILWGTTGSLRKATEWAANVGKLVAYLMFGYAIYLFLNGNTVGGLWTAAIAWFLHSAASTSAQQVVLEQRLRRVRTADIVTHDDTSVPPGMAISELVDQVVLPSNRRAVPVVDNGRFVGLVTIGQIAAVPPEQRKDMTVAHIMTPRDKLQTVPADMRVLDAIEQMGELDQVPVMEGERVIGLLAHSDVTRQLHLREALDV